MFLWAFASQLQRVFLFGCHKDDATLDHMLPPDIFDGIGVSDDAAVYENRFTQGQKCWAHLLRKAIKLAFLSPHKKKYQCFLDEVLQIYRDGKSAAADGRLGEVGRRQRVDDLSSRLLDVCVRRRETTTPQMTPHEREFANLVEEIQRLLLAEELFTFVLVPEVEATNNLSERNLRVRPKAARPTGQQDGDRRASPQRDRECTGIAAGELGEILPDHGIGGGNALDGERRQLVRRAMAGVSSRAGRTPAQPRIAAAAPATMDIYLLVLLAERIEGATTTTLKRDRVAGAVQDLRITLGSSTTANAFR